MPKASKFSPDEGITIYDLKDSEAVHYGEQAKGYVGKNLLRPTINNPTKSDSGVSWSFNANNSITINGIKTTGSTFINYVEALGSTRYATWDLYLEAGTYVLSGCESPFEYIRLTDENNNELASDTGSGTTFTLAQDYHGCKILIKLPQNTQVTNKTLYPMLRLASITDNTYEPYLTPNTEIPDKMSYADNAILGAKNLLVYPYTQTSRTVEGVEVTDNGDGTLTLNGTYTGTSYSNFGINSPISIVKNVPVKLGLIIENDNTNNLMLQAWNYDGNSHQVICRPNKISDSFVITASTNNGIFLQFDASLKDHTFNNCIVKPFILLASDTDINWQPYAMTNRELTNDKLDAKILTNKIENDITSSSAHLLGDRFIYNGQFCIAKTDIAIGDTFVLNTNYIISHINDVLPSYWYNKMFSGVSMADIFDEIKHGRPQGFALFSFVNCTGLPTIVSGFAIMMWDNNLSNSKAQVLAFFQGNIETAYVGS